MAAQYTLTLTGVTQDAWLRIRASALNLHAAHIAGFGSRTGFMGEDVSFAYDPQAQQLTITAANFQTELNSPDSMDPGFPGRLASWLGAV